MVVAPSTQVGRWCGCVIDVDGGGRIVDAEGRVVVVAWALVFVVGDIGTVIPWHLKQLTLVTTTRQIFEIKVVTELVGY